MSLSIYDELGEDERLALEEHLKGCEPCAKELESLKKLHVVLGSRPLIEASDELLEQSRMQLRANLRAERLKQSFWQRFVESTPPWITRYGAAWSGAMALVIGLLIGHFAFQAPQPAPVPASNGRPGTQQAEWKPEPNSDLQFTNVKFIDNDTSDGQVEFTFNAVAPMHYKGSINDPKVQQVLTHAILNEENSGTRLTAINSLEHYQPKSSTDPEIKAALICAAMKDDNPAVRQQALTVLAKLPFDPEIKKTFLYVLMQDKNPGLRIEAIKGLEGKKVMDDQDVLDVLRKKVDTDENNYIRIRANQVLREVKQ
jgi:hypothetical protein